MDRVGFQRIADLRLREAEILLAAGEWDGAYYLMGYCVECALKACIAKRFKEHEVPDKKVVVSFYTHVLVELLALSELKSDFEVRTQTDADFENSWTVVRDWTETSRYEIGKPESVARDLHEAITSERSGVLPWLKAQW